MAEVIAFSRLIRAGLVGHPDTVRKRMSEMHTAMTRTIVDGGELDILKLCEVLETEIERFERNQGRGGNPDGPTPETARKLRQDPLRVLIQRGVIDKDDEDAIEELRTLRYKLTMGLVPGGTDPNGERVDTSRKGYTHPAEKLTERQALMLKHVYRPWANDANSKGIQTSKSRTISLTAFQLVTTVIEGETTLVSLEKKFKVRNATLSKPFKSAIQEFARLLGKAESEGKVPRRKKTTSSPQ